MAQRKQRNFKRQMWAVQSLEVPPSYNKDYIVSEYRVEEWSTGHVFVKRAYRDPKWHGTFAFHEGWVIGPRGAFKKISDSSY